MKTKSYDDQNKNNNHNHDKNEIKMKLWTKKGMRLRTYIKNKLKYKTWK